MTGHPFKVVHVSPRVQAFGGIESLHEYHRRFPLSQEFVALFDREPQMRAGYTNLGFSWRTPLWRMRRRFARALAPHRGSLVVYHNGWGLPLFHDLDGSIRRVVFFHANPAYHAGDFLSFAGLLDGAAGVTPALSAAWERALPELVPARTSILRAPVDPTIDLRRRRSMSEPLVIGYAGRIERAQKRLDHLPALVRALKTMGVHCRFEVLGDGLLRRPLERQLGDAVRFHGWLPKAEFWRTLVEWDALVMFSDYEGGAIALFEAMAAGVIPFFPAIGGSWGDIYVPQIDPRCLYPPGDMMALARSISEVLGVPPARLAESRERARTLVAPHRENEYQAACLALFRGVVNQPRLSRVRRRRWRAWDLLPLGMVTRLVPWALRLN